MPLLDVVTWLGRLLAGRRDAELVGLDSSRSVVLEAASLGSAASQVLQGAPRHATCRHDGVGVV